MDFNEQLRVLRAAQGDPALLALATVDLAYPTLAEADRAEIKLALEAAAIPHWIDEAILAALLDSRSKASAAAQFARLRELRVVELFPARGRDAVNVHEATRLALRKRIATDEPTRFTLMSQRAAAYFSMDSTPTGRIEWVYHLLSSASDKDQGATELEKIHRDWMRRGHPEDRYALAAALQELLDTSAIQGRARVWATLVIAWSHSDRGKTAQLGEMAGVALRLARQASDLAAVGNAQCLLGDVFEAQGKVPKALAAFLKSLACSERLVKRNPTNVEWQWSLAITQRRVGSTLRAQGKLAKASVAFARSLTISRRLVTLDRQNPGWERSLAAAHSSLGSILAAQGKSTRALAEFAKFLAVSRRLVALDPANADWQRDVAVAHNLAGDVLESQGNLRGALTAFKRDLAISRRLVEQDPTNAGWQRDLADTLGRIGGILEAQGKVAEAEAAFAESLVISRRVVEHDPTNAESQRQCAVANNRIGVVLEAQGRFAEAIAAFEQDLEISRRLVKQNPTNKEWRQDLGNARACVAGVLVAQGKVDEALTVLAGDFTVVRRLLTRSRHKSGRAAGVGGHGRARRLRAR
jgi:tetratricopeptide (TPR) repeat protein